MRFTITVNPNRRSMSYCQPLLCLFLLCSWLFSIPILAADSCPTGTDLIASYTWNGTTYELSDGTDDLIYLLEGANQDSLNWSSVIGVTGICINGTNADHSEALAFSNFVGKVTSTASTGGIESISFCKAPDDPLCKKDVLYGMSSDGGLYALSFTEAYSEGVPFASISELDTDGSAAIGVVPTNDSLYYITLLDDNHEFHCFNLSTGVNTFVGEVDAPNGATDLNFVRLTVDDNGNIYAIQGGNQTLFFIDPNTVTNGFVNSTNLTIGGDTIGNYGDIAFDIDGNLWAISENGLFIVSQDPNNNWVATFICDPGIVNGNGIAIKPDGIGYITDSSIPLSQIYELDFSSYFSGGDLCSTVQLIGEVDNPGEGDENGTRIFDLTTYNAQIAISCDISCPNDADNRVVTVKAIGGFDQSYDLIVTDENGDMMPIANDAGTINNFTFDAPADGSGYELFLTDAGACSVAKNITVTEALDVSYEVICNADGSKTASFEVTGGGPPYLFSMDGGNTFNPVPNPFLIDGTGVINIIVSDNSQCTVSATAVLGDTNSCDDGLDCTEDVFDPVTCTCSYTPIEDFATSCDDGLDCTEDFYDFESCACAFIPIPDAGTSCDDGLDCTEDSYDAATCACVHIPIPEAETSCDDGLDCTEDYYDYDSCACVYIPIPEAGTSCDDGLDCTIDAYDYDSCACTHTPDQEFAAGCEDADPCVTTSYDFSNCSCNTTTSEPSSVEINLPLTYACSGSILNLNDYLTADITGTISWNDIEDATHVLVETGCETVSYTFSGIAASQTPDGCPSNIYFTINIEVYPAISFEVIETGCTIEIIDYCEHFWINWITSENKPGNGPLFEADEDESGLCEFTIYNPEATAVGIPFFCQIATVSIPYYCAPSCEGVSCDDGLDCTEDILNEETCQCSNIPIPEAGVSCDDGLDCTEDSYDFATCACVNTPIESLATSCDDGLDCTTDSYDYATCACVYEPIEDLATSCDDGLDCTMDSYDYATCACMNELMDEGNNNCDDGLVCTLDSFDPTTCACVHEPIEDLANNCDDGLDCTTDSYDYTTCTCNHVPNEDLATSCDDGLDCTTDSYDYETCACVNEPIAELFTSCDDGVACTLDYYDYENCACVNEEDPNYGSPLTWQTYEVSICSGSYVDLNSYITDNNDELSWQDVNAGTMVVDPTNILLEAACEGQVIVFQAFYDSFDENGCAITVEARVVIDVYPALTFDILENECSIEIINFCENFEISWTHNGQSGDGPVFNAEDGNSGTVEFTIEHAAALGFAPDACQTTTTSIDYDCNPTECPQLINAVCSPTLVCSGESISLDIEIVNDDGGTLVWYDTHNNVIDNPNAVVLTTDMCEGEEIGFYAVYTPTNGDCETLTSFTNTAYIYPEISFTTNATDCSIDIEDVCYNFLINWEDNLGNIGTGTHYDAPQGVAGDVTFTVSFPSIFAPDNCQSVSITENFACNVTCGDYEICTGPVEPIELCPIFCDLEEYSLVQITSMFNCSIIYLDEHCFRYIPLPGMEIVEQDLITVVACNPSGEICDTLYIMANVSENCGAEIMAHPDTITTDCEAIDIDVLANDEGIDLEICEIFIDPNIGTADITESGIVYTPANGFAGEANFTYTACNDLGGSSSTTVTVIVEGPTYEGTIGQEDSADTDGQMITIDVLANDTDGAYICAVGASDAGTIIEENGVLIFMPSINFEGTATFTYDACIDTDCGAVSQSIPVTVIVYPPNCENEDVLTCSLPLTHNVLCPEFCLFDGSYNVNPEYSITEVSSFFTICSISEIDDHCFRYIPVPSFELFPDLRDTITVVGCNIDGVCDTITYVVEVSPDCGEEMEEEPEEEMEVEEGFKPLNEMDDYQVTIYPNPNQGLFNLALFANIETEQTFTVYNVLGQLIKQIDIPANSAIESLSIDLRDQPKGTYFLQWQSAAHTKVESFVVY